MSRSVVLRADPASLSRRILAIVAALALALAALLASAGRTAETLAAAALPALAATGPGKLGLLRAQALAAGGRPTSAMTSAAKAALAGAALSDEPFTFAAAVGFAKADATGSAHDGALLREAIRRNPRSREARLLLLRHALGQNQLGEAIGQLAVLNRLGFPAGVGMVKALGSEIKSDRQVDEAIAALRPHPELFAPFILGFSSSDKPASLVARLSAGLPANVLADRDNRRTIINQLVEAGAYSSARNVWQMHEGASGGNRDAGIGRTAVHSPDFSDARSAPPFNWYLAEDVIGAAERLAGGGIAVSYYGRVHGVLASQLLTLPPGSYQAEVRYRTEGGTPGAIALIVRCAAPRSTSSVTLGEAPLTAPAGGIKTMRLSFTVPAQACTGQHLVLGGRLTENREGQDVFVQRLELVQGTAP